MASTTITACSTTSSITRVPLVHNNYESVSRLSSALAMSRTVKVKCSMQRKVQREQEGESKLGLSASLVAATCATTISNTPMAMALVDERMSTEGT